MHAIKSTLVLAAVLGLAAGCTQNKDVRESSSPSSAGSSDYSINRMQNGQFEVVWPSRNCIGTFNRKGEAMSYSKGCNDDLISRSQSIAHKNAKGGTGPAAGSSSQYKRGYNDAVNGRPFDKDRHPQDYKDVYRAGEEAR